MVEAFLGIQILALSFSMLMLFLSFTQFKRKNIGSPEFIFWVICWTLVIFFAFFPRTLDPIVGGKFVARALDAVMLVAFIILSYLGFQNHIGVKSLQKEIETLVREMAIKEKKKK